MNKRILILLASVLVIAAIVAACGSGGSSSSSSSGASSNSAPAKDSAIIAEPPNAPAYYVFPLTPMDNYNGLNDAYFQDLIYRPLYWIGDHGQVKVYDQISLADAPTYTDGGKTAVLKLRDYSWSDGTKITSRDVLFFWNLLKASKENWAGYVPSEFPDNVTKVATPDDSTITFTFDKVYNADWILYNELSQITPMPQHLWDKTSDSGKVGDFDQTPAGAKKVYSYLIKQGAQADTYASNPLWQVVSGPWKIQSFANGNEVTLAANDAYSGPIKPTLKTITLKPFTSDTAEFNVLAAGGVDLRDSAAARAPVLRQAQQGPGEHGGSGFVAGNQHGHEVVAQLAVAQVGAPGVHQKPQQRRVADFAIVASCQGIGVGQGAGGAGPVDEVVQAGIDDGQVSPEGALAGDEHVGQGQVPVRNVKGRSVFRLFEHAVNRPNDRGFGGDGPKVVVEDAQADYVQAERQELLLHVDHAARPAPAARHRLQLGRGPQGHVPKHAGHGVQPGSVEGGHDRAAAGFPRFQVGGDQALAHDGLQDFGQYALVVVEGIFL